MDIKALRYFLAVVQEGNITRAAEKLCIAQPPLSRQMKLLEEELGVTLFTRGKKHFQLTPEGLFLKQQAEEIVFLMEKTEQQMGKMREQEYGLVSVGATETCGVGVLSEMVEKFHELAPNIQFRIWTGSSDEIQDHLEKNLVDIGVIRAPFPMEQYERHFLKNEAWIAVFSLEHPLAALTENVVELSLLKEQPLMIPIRRSVQNEINSWFNEIVSERNIFCFYNSVTSVAGMAERGVGVIICPESARNFLNEDRLTDREIIDPHHESQVFLVKKRYQVLPTAAERFWNFAVQYGQKKKT